MCFGLLVGCLFLCLFSATERKAERSSACAANGHRIPEYIVSLSLFLLVLSQSKWYFLIVLSARRALLSVYQRFAFYKYFIFINFYCRNIGGTTIRSLQWNALHVSTISSQFGSTLGVNLWTLCIEEPISPTKASSFKAVLSNRPTYVHCAIATYSQQQYLVKYFLGEFPELWVYFWSVCRISWLDVNPLTDKEN